MTKWSIYTSDKNYRNKSKSEMTTAWLIWWLLFGATEYIVTVNKMRDK